MAGQPQKMFLSRRANGRYLLSKLCPVLVPILRSSDVELWAEHGDPMAVEICEFSVERTYGERLEPLEMVQVMVAITKVPGPPRTFDGT